MKNTTVLQQALLLGIAMAISSCNLGGQQGTGDACVGPKHDNYILSYIDANKLRISDDVSEENQLHIAVFPEGRKIDLNSDRSEFLALAQARNDFGFNRPNGFEGALTKTVANLSIDVTPNWLAPGSNQDLGEIVMVQFLSAQEYIANKYDWKGLEHIYRTKIDEETGQNYAVWGERLLSLNSFNSQSLLSRSILLAAFHLIFTTPPHQPGDYTFTVTINLGEGDDIDTFTTSIGPIRVELQ
jgi:hypothetical protein